jgi:hypothetical protein
MLTKEEVQSIVSENIESVYDRIMDKIPQIISSTIDRINHHTAPETHDRLVNLEKKADQNKTEHQIIMDKLDLMQQTHDTNTSLLQEIKDKKTFKKVVSDFFKKWWHLFSLCITGAGILIDHYFRRNG